VTDDIKPRVDEDGVAWCDDGCPQANKCEYYSCEDIAGLLAWTAESTFCCEVCPVAARRNATLLRDCREMLYEVETCVAVYQPGSMPKFRALLERFGE
jgi:hypothetical protein